jgi:hypothetical protein
MKTLTWTPETTAARRVAALLLHRAGHWLDQWAHQLTAAKPAAQADPLLEFHAEAGAPEGALYVDGRRVGVLPGVMRL